MDKIFQIPLYFRLFFYGMLLRLRSRRCGKKVFSDAPLAWYGLNRLTLGDRVSFGYKCWISVLTRLSSGAELHIGEGTRIGNFNHIVALGKVEIGREVLTADHVYISDNQHEYEEIERPVILQPARQCRTTSIGDGSWLGEHVCVIGARIGKHCVIGANSVVTRDIPDYCVAAGSPARIIKHYDFNRKIWCKEEI